MAFKTEQRTIKELFGRNIFTIPRNQRKYVWTETNWNELFNDLEFSSENSFKPHFFGSIVLKNEENNGDVNHYSIIDGQQRVITSIIILVAIMQIFKDNNEESKFLGQKPFLITTDLSNNNLSKIHSDCYLSLYNIIQQVCNWDSTYKDINQLINLDTSDSSKSSSIIKCLYFFYNKLSICKLDTVINLRDSLIKTKYVEIIADTEEDSYTIFEILNARGQELESHELLKNYVMRYTTPVANVDSLKARWEQEINCGLQKFQDQFVDHYVTHKYNYNGKEELSKYEVIKKFNEVTKISSFTEDFFLKAKYYRKITLLNNDRSEYTDTEYFVFGFMRSKNSMLFRPLFLSLMHHTETKEISTKQYEALLLFIQHFFICYNLISQETSNKISQLARKHSNEIERNPSQQSIKSLINDLIAKLPSKEEFIRIYETLGWSKCYDFYKDSSNKNRVKIALGTLERIKSGKNEIGDYTIEHILPDSKSKENALIGNLIPLEESLNNNAKDKDFVSKVIIYGNSSYMTARNIQKRYGSDLTINIKERAKIMASDTYDYIEQVKNKALIYSN